MHPNALIPIDQLYPSSTENVAPTPDKLPSAWKKQVDILLIWAGKI